MAEGRRPDEMVDKAGRNRIAAIVAPAQGKAAQRYVGADDVSGRPGAHDRGPDEKLRQAESRIVRKWTGPRAAREHRAAATDPAPLGDDAGEAAAFQVEGPNGAVFDNGDARPVRGGGRAPEPPDRARLRPSLGVAIPPIQSPATPGSSSPTSFRVSIRVSSWCRPAVSHQSSNFASFCRSEAT